MKALKHTLVLWSFLLWAPSAVSAEELPTGLPEAVRISAAKLEQTKKVVQDLIDKKEFSGAVVMIARRGKVVQREAIGMMDIEAAKKMKPDTIFRIYSMTKPITTVAALMLWEEGRFQLDDPVSNYLSEFKGLRVHAGKQDETVDAKREVTIRDLMRHTSGLTYGFFGDTPVDKLYKDRKVLAPDDNLQDLVTKLGKIPLVSQPGTKWHYSVSTDVLGRLVEVISGKDLDSFFAERIFAPLDMKDTGFFVPQDKRERLAANYSRGDKGGLKVNDAPTQSRYLKKPKMLSGGGGLVSTARDYTRFCQMLLDGGQLQGTRLLKPETVKLLSSNQLPKGVEGPGKGVGFGLGFAVRLEPAKPESAGAVGEYYWAGAASTTFWICPKHDLVVVAMTQFMPYTSKLGDAVKRAAYESILEPDATKTDTGK